MDLIGKEVFATVNLWKSEGENSVYGEYILTHIEGIFVGFGIKAVNMCGVHNNETAAIVFEPATGRIYLVRFLDICFKM